MNFDIGKKSNDFEHDFTLEIYKIDRIIQRLRFAYSLTIDKNVI